MQVFVRLPDATRCGASEGRRDVAGRNVVSEGGKGRSEVECTCVVLSSSTTYKREESRRQSAPKARAPGQAGT